MYQAPGKLHFVAFMLIFVLALQTTAQKSFPKSFFVLSKNLRIRFAAEKFYTMNRIEYKGRLLGLDTRKSHYGTVFLLPGEGFIGTGHTEVENEQLESMKAWSDGKRIKLTGMKNGAVIKTDDFKLVRESSIRGIKIINTIKISNDIIDEQVSIRSPKDVKLALLYNFMHPWTNSMDIFDGETVNQKIKHGEFSNSKKSYFMEDFKWLVLYSSQLQTGIITWKIQNTCPDKSVAKLWDRSCYKKFYYRSYVNKTLKKNVTVNFQVKTGFFNSPPNERLEAAKKVYAF
jgi:hypothetical protein